MASTRIINLPDAEDPSNDDFVMLDGNTGGARKLSADTFAKVSALSPVATTGEYDDLTSKPTLGTAAAKDVGTEADTIAAGDDIRLGYTRSQLAARSFPSGVTSILTNGYSASGDGGAALYKEVDTAPAHDLWFTSADGKKWEIAEEKPTIFQAGGKLDGTTDDAAALRKLIIYSSITSKTGVIPAGVLAATPQSVAGLTGDVSIECAATIKNLAGASATQRLLLVGGDGTKKIRWHGGNFDQNGGAFSCLEISTWDEAVVHIDEAKGIVCTEDSTTSTSGLVFAECRVGLASWDYMHDMDKGTSTQGSLPRCFSISTMPASLNRNDCTVHIGRCEDVHGLIVVGRMNGGVLTTYGGVCKNVADNGIYNVDNAAGVECHDLRLDTIDEPFVNSGTGYINAYRPIIRNSTNAIGLQNCEAIRIFDGDLQFAPGVAPFKTRSAPATNIAAGSFEIYRSRIECTPATRVCDFGSSGTLEDFIDIGNTWIVNYHSDYTVIAGGVVVLMTMAPGDRCRVESDSTWILRDKSGDLPASTTFFLNMPTVAELSRWDGPLINETGVSTSRLRLADARQKLFGFKNKFSINNVQGEVEGNFGDLTSASPRVVFGIAAPTSGYWPRGSIIQNMEPDFGEASSWVCITAGSPGVWEPVGRVRLQGANGYAGETLAAGAFGTEITVTVTGAAIGDFIESLAPSVASVGEVWVGYISAANTVKARPQNTTGGSINTTTGNIRVRVQKL